jgi:hypothetical protein
LIEADFTELSVIPLILASMLFLLPLSEEQTCFLMPDSVRALGYRHGDAPD